jgi:hypothetical protein
MYTANHNHVNQYPITVGASETNAVVSNVVRLESADRMGIAVLCRATACTGTVEFDVQHSPDGVNHWTAINTTDCRLSFTSATTQRLFINQLNTNAKLYLPLFPFVRCVVTTVGGESITIDNIHITYTTQ